MVHLSSLPTVVVFRSHEGYLLLLRKEQSGNEMASYQIHLSTWRSPLQPMRKCTSFEKWQCCQIEKVCIPSQESTFSVTKPLLNFFQRKMQILFFFMCLENYVWVLYRKGLNKCLFLFVLQIKNTTL